MVVALGVRQDGRKVVLGLLQGASESAAAVSEPPRDPSERGVDFTQPRP